MMVKSVDEKILDVLRRGDNGLYFSGRELGRKLSLSRTAIWKHIKGLRKAGYNIESRPSQGYRLKESSKPFNELEMTADLETRVMGRPLFYFQKVESTSAVALELAEKKSPEGTTVIADYQEHGKGRMGRSWESPPGVNLYLSLILRPPFSPVHGSQMTFLAANAVVKSIKKLPFLTSPEIKWPNDILINNKKVAGILTEMNSEIDRINFIILGIGINLNMPMEMFPAKLTPTATSLYVESGQKIDRSKFARSLLYEIEKEYDTLKKVGFAPLLKYWKSHAQCNGKRVVVNQLDGETTKGEITSVDDDGALLIKVRSGKVKRIISGDLTFIDNKG